MRPHLSLYILAGCLAGLLSGCGPALPSHLAGGGCYGKSLPVLLDSTDLRELFQDIAGDLCSDGSADSSPADGKQPRRYNRDTDNLETVLVTDFADIQTFQPSQSGLLMGELMRGSLNNVCRYRIVQAEFGRYFKLSENGLTLLTRKVNEIKKDEYSQAEAVVGTYNYLNNNKVVIFVRKINMATGRISRMATKEINYSCAGRAVVGYNIR